MTQMPKVVLIVEDSPVQALALRQLLEQKGLHVLHASDGRIGVSMAEICMPDAIVLDVQMPEMNGFEVCRCLKANQQTANIPVVMLTTHDDPELVTLGDQLGAVEFIPKGAFSEAVLLQTLRQLDVL